MGNSWLTVVGYPIIFCTPWIAGIVWVCRRTPGSGDDTPPPSMGERARSRMNLG
jgi:hypothetical protein